MSHTLSVSIPTLDDVARIVATPDRVIRNLEITQCDADLSAGLRLRVGGAANRFARRRADSRAEGPAADRSGRAAFGCAAGGTGATPPAAH